MKKSFTLLEIIFVLIIIGILSTSMNFSFSDTSLLRAGDQIVSHLNYTRHLAIKENKMQYYPINNSATEMNRSKYWFKQWWQIRFSQKTSDPKDYWYEIFTDVPYDNGKNFDKYGNTPTPKWDITYAKNPSDKYLIGNCDVSNYPDCIDSDTKLNLSKTYGIKKMLFINIPNKRLLFDNYGNVYLDEGEQGDANDTNPYDNNEREPLLNTAKIVLCKDDNCEINTTICISPKIGNAYLCN